MNEGFSTGKIVLASATVIFMLSMAVSPSGNLNKQSEWNNGTFNQTSADRNDNSGDLGIGYLNGTSGDNLTGFWRLDRNISGNGTNVTDYSGNSRDGELNGSIDTFDTGVFSTKSFLFDGTDDYVDLQQSSVPEWWNGEPVSVSVWFKTSGSGVILGNAGGDHPTDSNGWVPALYVGTQGKLHTSLFWHGDTATTTSSTSYDNSDWHHAVATYKSGNETLYIDGQKVSERTGLSQTDYNSGSYSYFIGSGHWDGWPGSSGSTGWFDGKIDEVKIRKDEMNLSEVKDLYFGGPTFSGNYSYIEGGGNGKDSWGKIEINGSIPMNTELSAEVEALDSGSVIDTQKFGVQQGLKNYSLNIDNSEKAKIYLRGNSTRENSTWETSSVEVFYQTPIEVSSVKASDVEEGMEINVTASIQDVNNEVENVTLNLTDPDGNKELESAKMENGSGVFFYEYTVQDEASNVGKWFANVTADTGLEEAQNSTSFQVTEGKKPKWRNHQQAENIIDPKAENELKAEGFDNFNLSYAILSTNETGAFENKTSNYSSPKKIFESGSYEWTNFTWKNDSVENTTVSWRIWYNDTSGRYNSTDLKSFQIRAEDTEKPEVTILSPGNETLSDDTPLLNATANEEIDIWKYSVDGSANQTFEPATTIGPLSDSTHNVTVWANDTGSNWGRNNVSFTVETAKPEWRNLKSNASSIVQGEELNISVELRDTDSGIYKGLLATNDSKSFENRSTYGSPEFLGNVTDWSLADFTFSNSSFFGNLGFSVWFRDLAGNWNITDTSSVEVREQISVKSEKLVDPKDWNGEFNYTSSTRDDNSGDLGLGYTNGTTGDNLTGYWRLDRTVSSDGGTLKDYSGDGRDGTVEGAATGLPGVFGTDAHSYDGSSDYSHIPNSSIPEWWNGERVSVSAWFKTSGSGVILGNEGYENGGPGSNSGWVPSLYVGSQGKVHTSLFWHDETTTTNSSGSYNDSEWHHVAATYNSGVETLYLDGQKVAERTGLTQKKFNSESYAYFLGSGQWDSWPGSSGTIGYFDGKIDEFQVYSEGLNQSEVNDLYLGGEPFEGSYSESISIPSSGRLEQMEVSYSDASSGNQSWVKISTSKGETETVQLDGSSMDTIDLNFTNDGGSGTLELNFTSQGPSLTPVIENLTLVSDSLTYRVNSTLKNSTGGNFKGAEISFNRLGEQISSSTLGTGVSSLEDGLATDLNYTLDQKVPVFDSEFSAEIKDYRPDTDEKLESQVVDNYTGSVPSEVSKVKTVYAFNDTGVEFGKARLVFPKFDLEPNTILHCTDWDFSSAECNTWEVNTTSDYNAEENSTHIWFETSKFDAFGVGKSPTLPNVTELEVYDVTGLSESQKETEGSLVDSGLNSTIDIKTRKEKTYRVQFKIVNEKDTEWNIEAEDELFHSGLNNSWDVNKIWYNISQDYDGGTFSSGKVDWNTSNGGTLGANDSMYAKYLVNISKDSENLYDLDFKVNDTSENSGSTDNHEFNVTALGTLNVTLDVPPPNTTTSVCRYDNFDLNGTVRCEGGVCGDVDGSARYNQSSEADTLIPEGSGTPFHTQGVNLKTASSGLSEGESANISWKVNATGDIGSSYLVDANFSSGFSEIPDNDTDDAKLDISDSLTVTFRKDSVDFGLLDPGVKDKPANDNSNGGYNITVESCTTEPDLYTKSTNLTTTGWGAKNYSIEPENISFAKQNDISQETFFERNFQLLESNVTSNSNVTSFYWVDIPAGIKSSEYNGTLSFKVNGTG